MSFLKSTFLVISLLLPLARPQSTCRTQTIDLFSFFGFPDGNSAQGSFPCPQNPLDGGDGSYANPETFATAQSNTDFANCDIIYIPYFKKYFQYHDHCVACDEEFNGTYPAHPTPKGYVHLDLWIGPQSLVEGQSDCELNFGTLSGKEILRDPGNGLEVVSTPIVAACTNPHPATDSSIAFPDNAASCSGSSSNPNPNPNPNVASSAPAIPAPSSTPLFTGDPLTVGKVRIEKLAAGDTLPANTVSTQVPGTTGTSAPQLGGQFVELAMQQPPPSTLLTLTTSTGSISAPPASTQTGGGGRKIDWTSSESYRAQVAAEEANCASWGACLGDRCRTWDDCAGEWVCAGEVCSVG
ncbi:hypothetical protein MMC21_003704 [Puttea exsequens]|nr:hypothetical protein [Puttea exsequens]